jgi:hypothetical protein
MNILLYNNKTVFWLQSIEPDTTQAFKHSCLNKTCPTTMIHWSQIKPTYFQNLLYKKRSLFFLATQKFLVTNYQHVVRKEVNLVYTEMKERQELTNPPRVLLHYHCKSSHLLQNNEINHTCVICHKHLHRPWSRVGEN